MKCPRCQQENPQGIEFCYECGQSLAEPAPQPPPPSSSELTSFAAGRYRSRGSWAWAARRRVYLAHDPLLDRDVAFTLIKTEGLHEVSRTRITTDAQAMGRLGSYPHIVMVFDLGEHEGSPTW